MAGIGGEIDGQGRAEQLLEIGLEGQRRAAVLTDHDGRDALGGQHRHVRRPVRLAIVMTVGVDETGRQDQPLGVDHRLAGRGLEPADSDDAVGFIGRSLFRGSIDLPVNVPIGRYATQVYLFRDGKLLSQSQSSLQVHKVGFERVVYMLAFRYPLAYGLLAVLMAVAAGLLAYSAFRRRE